MALEFGSAEARVALEREKKALKVEMVVNVASDEWGSYRELKERIGHLEYELNEAEDDLAQIQLDWEKRGVKWTEVEEVMEAKHDEDGRGD